MGAIYNKVLRPILFTQDPEKAHDLALLFLRTMANLPSACWMLEKWKRPSQTLPIELFGLKFPNAVGMAAGMDKNGDIWRTASAFGFGHVEIGTVTAQKQPGNQQPRVFRYPQHEAIINRMGFNNDGAEAIAAKLKRTASRKRRIPLGINIGKSKAAPIDKAVEDYLASFNLLAEYADYFAINVSSPNTPELRKLQGKAYLPVLLGELKAAAERRSKKLGGRPTPLLVKIAPDLTFRQIDDVLEAIENLGLAGVIATNTTVARPGPFATIHEAGGLSGKPLARRSLEVVNYISRATAGKLPIIGVGGITDEVSAGRMMDAGASLVQVYTGWVYKGPLWPKDIALALAPRHTSWIS